MSTSTVLDHEQLRDITMDDDELMREIVSALITDTAQQVPQLESAIREHNTEACMRLAHYSKGACANVGAMAAASLFKSIEQNARDNEFASCSASLANLGYELDRLRSEAGSF